MPSVKQKREAEQILGGEPVESRDVPPPLPRDIGTYGFVRLLVGTYYDLQNLRIHASNRVGALSRTVGVPEAQQAQFQEWVHEHLARLEAQVQSAVAANISKHPLWKQWLKGVKGIGPCIAGTIISHVSGDHYEAADRALPGETIVERAVPVGEGEEPIKGRFVVRRGIGAFATISKFWTYCGLGLDQNGLIQRRRAGVRSNWSPALKQAAWKAGESFVRCGAGYRELYEQHKARLVAIGPETLDLSLPDEKLLGRMLYHEYVPAKKDDLITKAILARLRRDGRLSSVVAQLRPAHIEARSRRWVSKIFMGHVWTRWRELEGLPTDLPWIIGKQGHKTIIPVVER